jgi:penicillin-binding protein 1A
MARSPRINPSDRPRASRAGGGSRAYRPPRGQPPPQPPSPPGPPARKPARKTAGKTAPGRGAPAKAPAAAGERRRGWGVVRWMVILSIWGMLALGAVLLWFARDLPRPEAALDSARRPSLALEDTGGRTFAAFGDVVGQPMRLSELPPYVPQAVVSVEDRRFWTHPGIDLIGMARAAFVNLRAGRVVQGGSTITQQVAKNLFLTNARTFKRKVQELLLTLWLEHHFTKREILEIWLNRVYLGSGAWGIDAASHIYFGIPATKLSLWQAAMIAGMPRAPSRFNPRADPEAAVARTKEVLAAMVETGDITRAQADAAVAAISLPPRPPAASGWFADWAAEQAQPALPSGTDAVLHTTLDSRLQSVVETKLDALLAGPGAAANAGQGAVVVLDARTGAVRAMAGGRSYAQSSYNRAVVMRRQPGSSFKPFVWLAALQKGLRPDDTVLDAPIRVGNWSPADFERRYLGEITIEEALAQSINTAAVRLELQAGGPRAVIRVARRLGITDKLPDNASIALGTGEVGLLEMSAAYAAFFNGGQLVSPWGVASITMNGTTTALPPTPPEPAIDPDQAAMMARMLTAVVTRGTGRAAGIAGRTVAGKTGTTQDYRDAWFIGWTNGAIIGVWIGNDDNQPMKNVTGGSLPAQLFRQIALEIR